MRLIFSLADQTDVPALAALHTAASAELTRQYGQGIWTSVATERGVLFHMRHAKVVIARHSKNIVGTLNLQTKKPWAIDVSYFTPVKRAIYLTGMAVLPSAQGKGIGKALLEEAAKQVRAWPADAIRLDAWDADAGAGEFYRKCGFRETGRVIYRKSPLIYLERLLLQEEANQP